MATETQVHDGTAWRPIKKIFVHNGTAWQTITNAWVNDGGTWRLVYTSGTTFLFAETISADTANYNLRTRMVAAGWPGTTDVDATVIINSGVRVYGTTLTGYAFLVSPTTNPLPANSKVTVNNNGAILGRGGDGGNGATAAFYSVNTPTNPFPTINTTNFTTGSVPATNGTPGGNAFYTNNNVTINNTGVIYGGGGGGGGGGGRGVMAAAPASPTQPQLINAAAAVAGGSGGGGGAGWTAPATLPAGGAAGPFVINDPALTDPAIDFIEGGIVGNAGSSGSTTPGAGGPAATRTITNTQPGAYGTATATGGVGGPGGAWAQAGTAGGTGSGTGIPVTNPVSGVSGTRGLGGAAGYAINGWSKVTYSGTPIPAPQVIN